MTHRCIRSRDRRKIKDRKSERIYRKTVKGKDRETTRCYDLLCLVKWDKIDKTKNVNTRISLRINFKDIKDAKGKVSDNQKKEEIHANFERVLNIMRLK